MFGGHLQSFPFFVGHIVDVVLEASHCFCRTFRKVFTVFVGRFSLFLLAVLEASCCFCQLSWKYLADLLAILKASCSFCYPFSKLLTVLVSLSCCFVVGCFSCCFVFLLAHSSLF